jgi:hypothetical protein
MDSVVITVNLQLISVQGQLRLAMASS